ncbi:MAG: hypothetical protein AAFR53_09695 [Pseudomonadota bacterium]
MNGPVRTAAVLSLLAAPAAAQEVSPCDWRTQAAAIVEPWEKHTRTFGSGAVRLALMDVVEPAAGAFHLMILSPPFDELGTRQCRALSFEGSMGFAGIDFPRLTASYDPAQGLIWEVPVSIIDPASGGIAPRALRFVLNQATGALRAEFF